MVHALNTRPLYLKGKTQDSPLQVEHLALVPVEGVVDTLAEDMFDDVADGVVDTLADGVVDTLANGLVDAVADGGLVAIADDMVEDVTDGVVVEVGEDVTPGQSLLQKPHLNPTRLPLLSTIKNWVGHQGEGFAY